MFIDVTFKSHLLHLDGRQKKNRVERADIRFHHFADGYDDFSRCRKQWLHSNKLAFRLISLQRWKWLEMGNFAFSRKNFSFIFRGSENLWKLTSINLCLKWRQTRRNEGCWEMRWRREERNQSIFYAPLNAIQKSCSGSQAHCEIQKCLQEGNWNLKSKTCRMQKNRSALYSNGRPNATMKLFWFHFRFPLLSYHTVSAHGCMKLHFPNQFISLLHEHI